MSRREVLLDSYNPHRVITALSKAFKTKIEDHQAEHRIQIPRALGTGYIGGVDFKDGLGVLLFNCEFKKDVVLRYVTTDNQPLRLIFCLENDLTHIIKADRLQYQLNGLLGSMV